MTIYSKHFARCTLALIWCASALFMGNQLKAQDLSDTTHYKQLKQHYFQLLEDTNTIKHALRIKAKILNKLDQHGSKNAYNRAMTNICGNYCDGPDQADWNYAGISEYTTGLIQWNGYVEEVLADPGRMNSGTPEEGLLLGTPTSGIFRYNPSPAGWENRTDPLNSPAMGISKILRNPADTSHLLASTGISHTGDYGGGMGLIASNDNGQNWYSWTNGMNSSAFNVCDDHITGLYEHVDYLGDKSNLNHAFYFAVRKQFEDKLYAFCGVGGSIYFDITPFWGSKRISDFTANENGTVLVSTENPWGYGTELWHGVKNAQDCGAVTWTNITTNLENAIGGSFQGSMNQLISLSDSKNNTIFARTKGVQSNEIYRSTDGGLSWEMRHSSPFLAGRSFRMLEYSDDTKLLYLGHENFHVWDDQNQNFYSFSNQMHVDIRDLDFAGINNLGQELFYLSTDGGVTEGIYDPSLGLPTGMSFRPISGNSMAIQQFWGIGITQDCSDNFAAGAMHNYSFANVGGVDCQFAAGDGSYIEIDPVDNNTVYFSINTSLRKGSLSSICGSWGNQIGSTSQWQFGCPLELHPHSPSLVFYGDDVGNGLPAQLKIYNDNGPPQQVVPLTNVTSTDYMQTIGSIGLTEAAPTQVLLGARDDFPDPSKSGKLLKIENFSSGAWTDLSNTPVTNDGGLAFKDATAWMPIGDIVVSPYDEDLFFVSIQGTNSAKRVYRSMDGGATFQDWSTGLHSGPVNNLEFLYNSNDLVIAATDNGAYYRDNTMPAWVCFNERLPLVWTTDIDVNYCKNEAWAATHGRGIYKTTLDNLPRVARQHEITGTSTWNQDRVVYSDVIVKPGAQLNINGALVKFAPGKRILVEAGGMLQVFNSELTSLCEDDCWDGITIEGNTNLPQSTSNQGSGFLSGSTISHAKNAVNVLGVTNDLSQLAWNQMGGIITCNNVDFINNRRAIQFQAYENTINGTPTNNLSRIENSRFIINDDYRNNCGSNSPFITMNEVDGVLIAGNTFRDDRNSLSNPQDFRSGIGTNSSTFRVQNSTLGPNSFVNLHRGVEVGNVNEDNPFVLEIEDAQFMSCETGIRLYDVNNESELLRNKIDVGHPQSASGFGIVLHNSSGFEVEENIVQKQAGWSGFGRGYDILNTINPDNPGTPFFSHNLVYNNIASDLNEGFTAHGANVAANGIDGLEFLCNQNFNNGVDFNIIDCIQPQQGNSASPAGNTFSCGTSVGFQIGPSALGCITYNYQSVPCNPSFPSSYPGITFLSTTNAPGCNYLVSVEEFDALEEGILLYPNPALDKINIELISGGRLSSIQVFNLQGRDVTPQFDIVGLNELKKCQMNLTGLSKGGFLVKFTFENGRTVQKTFIVN